jgi:AraC-like DNA-binding protein
MYKVRSGAVAGLESLVKELGQNPIEVIESAGFKQSHFRDPDTYIAYDKLAELLELCGEHCAEPLFGLLLAQRQETAVLGALPVIVAHTATVGEALDSASKYLYLHASGVRFDQERRDHIARLALSFDFDSPLGVGQLMQLSVGHLAALVAQLTNIDRFGVTLHLKQPAPPSLDASRKPRYRRVRFGESFDGINLEGRSLDIPSHTNAAALGEHLQNYLLQLERRYPDNLELHVRDVIGRLLPVGECSVERVAATLNMHPRTLQARLKNEHRKSYREILQETRQGLAERYLVQGAGSITDLALQLGYAELAVFSRHFKRWSGVTPREWQKQHRQ